MIIEMDEPVDNNVDVEDAKAARCVLLELGLVLLKQELVAALELVAAMVELLQAEGVLLLPKHSRWQEEKRWSQYVTENSADHLLVISEL